MRIYRFSRALFGVTSSPFLLAGVIDEHLKAWEHRYPEVVKELRDGLYVDDLMMGGATVPETKTKKSIAEEVLEDATFTLHKWHSNAVKLEANEVPSVEGGELTYAKEQLGTSQSETKLLGLTWDKEQDILKVTFRKEKSVISKRNALSFLAKIYDPLGLVSPTTLLGKALYREMCEANIPWDADLPENLKKR